jgi:hypothetical protein
MFRVRLEYFLVLEWGGSVLQAGRRRQKKITEVVK